MINLYVKKPYQKSIIQQSLRLVVEKILTLIENSQEVEFSVRIESDEIVQKMNLQYRGLDQPTDVLSFESNMLDPETGRMNLGDILISYPTAEKQAIEAGHPVENEIILLILHGILHLSGYDHSTQKEKDQMWQKQQSILSSLGIQINRISGDEDFHD